MYRIALAMLVGDRSKFLGIVLGLAFGSLLMTQQGAIFRGVMVLSFNHVGDTPQADVWVCDPGMQEFDICYALRNRDLDNVRSVYGVRWAVPLLRTPVISRGGDGMNIQCIVMGIDDGTLIGAPLPEHLVAGSVDDLRRPDTVIIDEHGASTKFRVPVSEGVTRPLCVGDTLMMNARPVTVVGICKSTLAIMLFPTGYMLRSHLSDIARAGDQFNIVLAGLEGSMPMDDVCAAIRRATGLSARSSAELSRHLHDFILYNTGIPANFAIAILLGFIVGAAIAGQTFNQYVVENRRIFASMKAMGMRNSMLTRILIIQAVVAAILGYGIGIGCAVTFSMFLEGSDLAFRLEPQLLFIVLLVIIGTSVSAALASLRIILRLDPALVFRS